MFNQNALQFQHTNQALQQLPPEQQQALIAAQLSFAMAAAAQQGQLGMFENPQMNINHNSNSNNSNNNSHHKGNNNNNNKDDHRGSSSSRRQFERRGGGGGGGGNRGGRDDSYPGYDTKRARF